MDDWTAVLSLQNNVYLQLFLLAALLFVGWRLFAASARVIVRVAVIGLGLAIFASLMGFQVWGLLSW